MADDEKSIILYLKGFHKINKVRNLEFSKEGAGHDQLSLAKKAKEKTEDYDCIFCIFDQDACHRTDPHYVKYYQALDLLEHYDNIAAITSIPCYEIWLLLHFQSTYKSFANAGKKSICKMVISELKKCDGMQNYDKADNNIYLKTGQLRLDNAICHAELLEKSNERNNTDNPSTNIHLLIEYLQIYSR
ncbi:MAG: RloB family protein [Candidatus Marithrix sp.]